MANKEQPKIFMVDDNVTNLMVGRHLLRSYYNVYPLTSAAQLFTLLKKTMPNLILLDIEMPEMDGYETLEKLRADERYCDIPVIFLTAKTGESDEIKGFELGAVDYISKPFSAPILKKRVENHLLIVDQRENLRRHAHNLAALVREKTMEIYGLQNVVLGIVTDMAEFRDSFLSGHDFRTMSYMEVMLNEIVKDDTYANITCDWDMDFILPSCQLHDIGKIGISDLILNKPGKLTPEEFEIMKTHVSIGAEAIVRMIKKSPNSAFLVHAYNYVRAHHEKWNGKGYPAGLAGEDIPLEGRVMAIVDVYDALTSWRPYKNAFTHKEAKEIIVGSKGTHFEPRLVDIFLKAEDKFQEITLNNSTENK